MDFKSWFIEQNTQIPGGAVQKPAIPTGNINPQVSLTQQGKTKVNQLPPSPFNPSSKLYGTNIPMPSNMSSAGKQPDPTKYKISSFDPGPKPKSLTNLM